MNARLRLNGRLSMEPERILTLIELLIDELEDILPPSKVRAFRQLIAETWGVDSTEPELNQEGNPFIICPVSGNKCSCLKPICASPPKRPDAP